MFRNRWDCLNHVWVRWHRLHHTPFHNALGIPLIMRLFPKFFAPSKLGEIWLMCCGIPLRYVPPSNYPWNRA